ncbi:MAG: hypothetical protein IK100_11545 [Muribaculaceae bacterium]|nr:hypothetical protein [Muribaculaceae bacterium]
MKNLRNTLLVVMLSLCSFASYADETDYDILTIPASYINSSSTYSPQLVEKAATIFGEHYNLTLTNIYLSEYWFYCDIIIENFSGFPSDLTVTQICDNEYPQEDATDSGTISTLSQPSQVQGYDIFVHSEVRIYRADEEKTITVTYHFENHYKNDDYYLIVKFPYNHETWTGINDVTITPTSVEYYDIQGRKLDGPQPGIVIEKQGDKVTKKMYR